MTMAERSKAFGAKQQPTTPTTPGKEAGGGVKRLSAAFQAAQSQAIKCAKCTKSVYSAELVTALQSNFHASCFCCTKCQKKLALNAYEGIAGAPYCQNCFRLTSSNIVAGVKHAPVATEVVAASVQTEAAVEDTPTLSIAQLKANFKSTSVSNKVCPACKKSVYKAEEVVAVGESWHNACFLCGGAGELGCKRKISLGNFHGIEKSPYCDVCFTRLAAQAQAKASLAVTADTVGAQLSQTTLEDSEDPVPEA